MTRYAVVVGLLVFAGCDANGQAPENRRRAASDRETLIEAIADKLERLYPVEDVGRKTAEGMRENVRSGKYDGIASGKEFASRVTSDMEGLSRDRHLDLY